MYVPPHNVLSSSLDLDHDNDTVTMPKKVFEMLLAAAHAGQFDAQWYRSVYPDVADAVDCGQIGSEILHFAEGGYQEGRRPCSFAIDEAWYARANGDVEAALASGEVASAYFHYNHVGYFEGRAPDPASEFARARWIEALRRPRRANDRAA